jgi:hypothetical protein
VLLAAALAFAAGRADAITIVVTGNDGSSGIIGVDGGPGDPADATAISVDAANNATAQGGRGGDGGAGGAPASGGAGGAASALAETNVAGPASALATATGGDGGHAVGAGEVAGDGGDAVAEAHADGVGGSEARAIATGGRGGNGTIGALAGSGGDAILIDAVSGSDPDALVLEQRATGGARGHFGAGDGHAVSTGDFENPADGDLLALLVAIGGTAQVGGSATSSGAGDAALDALARASDALVLDPLLAQATGTGDASASLEAVLLSSGGSLSLTNRLDASAGAGATIALRQTAQADASSESILDVAKSAALLDLEANAEGGEASTLVRGSNDSGDLRLHGQALGGAADVDPEGARAEFEAHTSGDGQDIEIGGAGRPAGAVGGEGDRGDVDGGDAEAIATATALGNSAVHIDVFAEGGAVDGAANGAAEARAAGSGGGTEAVDVVATARGGDGFYSAGGDAFAEAIATGLGAVSARAIAHGGIHDESTPGGAGFARAQASGASGGVEAIASTTRLFDGEQADDEQLGILQVGLAATLAGQTAVTASSHLLDFSVDSAGPSIAGSIRSAYQAGPTLLGAALAGNAQALAAPPAKPKLFALVELALSSSAGLAQTYTADIVLGSDRFDAFREMDPKPEAVLFSFLDPELDAAAFGSLTLRSWDLRNPADIYEVTFATALDALTFLDDGRLLFGGVPRARHLEIILETTGAEGDFFLDLVVAAVPEPSLAALLALAVLAAFLARRVVASRPS